MTRYVLDAGARRLARGTVLVAGSPLRLFRLTAPGARLVDAVERGDDVESGPAASRLLDRLVEAGAAHPRPRHGPFSPADVTVVIPVRDAEVGELSARLAGVGRVVVVDDGSAVPIVSRGGAQVVHRPVQGGPAAARNTGLAAVDTPLVAFVDADVRVERGWLEPLLAHFADPRVGLVAPRVRGATTPAGSGLAATLARYEVARSPLDVGPREARVRARTRVAYVPAAAVVARVEAVRAVGGFDEGLRHGEDVDLVWRLDEAGWGVRYEPRSVVRHLARRRAAAWLAQRHAYGRSAAPLARRHPGAVAPLVIDAVSGVVGGAAVTGHPVVALVGVAGATGSLAWRLRGIPGTAGEALRLTLVDLGLSAAQLARTATREGLPVAVGAALLSRRARRLLLVAALAPALVDWLRERPPLDPVRYLGLRLADDAAYGLGVWAGALALRTTAPLRPELRLRWGDGPSGGRA